MCDAYSANSSSSQAHPSSRFFDALRRGAVGAIDLAERAAPQLGAAAEKGCETLVAGAVFAAVFPAALAVHLLPPSIKTGARKGVDSARRAAERLAGSEPPSRPAPRNEAAGCEVPSGT